VYGMGRRRLRNRVIRGLVLKELGTLMDVKQGGGGRGGVRRKKRQVVS